MAKFQDYLDLVDPLVLPIGGKEYTIPPVTLTDGVILNGIIAPEEGAEPVEKLSDEQFFRLLLGSVYDELRADNVPSAALSRMAMTALAEFQSGRGAAEVMWATGGSPKALQEWTDEQIQANRPNRASRRSKSTAEATTTPPPARTSGTRSRKA